MSTMPRQVGPQLDRPLFLRQLSTDEYAPLPYRLEDLRVIGRVQADLTAVAHSTSTPPVLLAGGRAGTAAGLRALNAEWKETYYDVPAEAVRDDEAAADAFDGPETVIDVQTHFAAPHACKVQAKVDMVTELFRMVMPDWWTDLDGEVRWDLATFITNVFLRTETAVAVLTSGPGTDDYRSLFNDEMAATREIVERFAGTGRLLNHALVHADIPEEIAAMEHWRDECRPAGWKVYTMGRPGPGGFDNGWMLDDEVVGLPFLERARDLGVHLVCSHKGVSQLAANGSPSDIGPAAKAFPEIDFLVYHSGYEMPIGGVPGEGPYSDETAHLGINRLISSVLEQGLGHHSNVYAELGTTWFSLVRRPREAAHVMGKLLQHFGPDNIIWGTDSIWYGSAQPLVDAFRVFQIPESMCEEFGYQQITPEDREKILSTNAARVYGIDLDATRKMIAHDDLAWARELVADYEANGYDRLR